MANTKYTWTISKVKGFEISLYTVGPVNGHGTATLGPKRLKKICDHFGVKQEALIDKTFESKETNATAALFGFIFEIMKID